MAHKIDELAPVGSQWKVKRGTFYKGRTITIVSHDLVEKRIRYVYDNDTREMTKPFDTFEREYVQSNIHIVDAAPEAAVSLCTGDVIKTADRSCNPFSGNTELTILDICGLTDTVKYKYKSGAICTKDLSQFHDSLRRGLITIIGRAPPQKVMAESGYKVGDLFDVCNMPDTLAAIHGTERNEPAKANAETITKPTMEKPMTRIVNVFLMDTTAGLKAAERMIGKVENFASDSTDNALLLLELSMEHDLKGMLHDHNKRRKAIINQDILNRVGKTVYLQPIELKDVKIDVQVVTAI